MSKTIYIRSSESISAQNLEGTLQPLETSETFVLTQEIDYKTLINPRKLRRMNKLVRMSHYNTMKLLGDEKPNFSAILTGTGLGCLKETLVFLNAINYEDAVISPTAFINSTHNTPGGHLANTLQQHCFNSTHTQREISFEMALIEASLFAEQGQNNILVGGFDEIQPMLIEVLSQNNLLKQNDLKSAYQIKVPYSEGAGFFIIDNELIGKNNICLDNVSVNRNKDTETAIQDQIEYYKAKKITKGLIFSGNNSSKYNEAHYEFLEHFKSTIPVIEYKKYLGEFACVSALALDFACKLIKKEIQIDQIDFSPKFIIIHNFTIDNYSSLISISNV